MLLTKHIKIMLSLSIIALIMLACNASETYPMKNKIDPELEKYWYEGKAEITSYKLSQARYGEMREGRAVMIFVTEPFSEKSMAKSDRPSSSDVSVLKLNFTKNFTTGIYPYSLMTSSFFPVEGGKHSVKISSSSQEWCGHSFMELQNSGKFSINTSSYFEGKSGSLSLSKNLLEDDVWSMIRLKHEDLPKGEIKMIPSFSFLGLMHKETKAYDCQASLSTDNKGNQQYKLFYPELDRTMIIIFESSFPHKIIRWEETYVDGYGSQRQKLSTTGEAIKTIKSAYWGKNSNADSMLRNELGLE